MPHRRRLGDENVPQPRTLGTQPQGRRRQVAGIVPKAPQGQEGFPADHQHGGAHGGDIAHLPVGEHVRAVEKAHAPLVAQRAAGHVHRVAPVQVDFFRGHQQGAHAGHVRPLGIHAQLRQPAPLQGHHPLDQEQQIVPRGRPGGGVQVPGPGALTGQTAAGLAPKGASLPAAGQQHLRHPLGRAAA